jgi:AraC-like DNA-binding protein/quercetin dioxygenase-like cupin family protein
MKKRETRVTLTKEDHFIHDNFPLIIAEREPQPEFGLHSHQFTELLVVTKGEAIHIIDGREYPVSAGDVFVIGGNQEHQFKNMRDLSLINIIFEPEGLKMNNWFIGELPGFRAIFQLEPEYRDNHNFESRLNMEPEELEKTLIIIRGLKEELRGERAGFKAASISLFINLLVHLSRSYENSLKPQSLSLLRIAMAINYLEKEFAGNIDFENLGKIAHMSLRNFQRVFKKTMGCSAREYLIDLRLSQSRRLLRTSDLTITEIAYASGFNDSNYYTRKFVEKNGVSPSQYRSVRGVS